MTSSSPDSSSPDPASPAPDPSSAPDPPSAPDATSSPGEAPPAPRLTLSYRQRIHSSRDFAAIYEAGRRAGDGHLLIFADRNNLGWSRYGLSVSRKHGNAVRRNRLRRLLRESFRLCQHELPVGYDFILIPRHNSGATLADYCRSITIQARRAVNRSSQPVRSTRGKVAPSGKRTGTGDSSQQPSAKSTSRGAPRRRGRGGQKQPPGQGADSGASSRSGDG